MSTPPPVMDAADLEDFLAAAFPLAPRTYRVVAVTETGVVMRLPIGDEHERPGGTVSGPAMMTIADAAAWIATVSRIGPVALSVTSSLTINFLRKPPMADLIARADLLKLGRRQSVCDVRLYSAPDRVEGTVLGGVEGSVERADVLAQATVTYAIP